MKTFTHEQIATEVAKLKWYHEIEVCEGVVTKPVARFREVWELIEQGIAPLDFMGKRVLDVGARDGKWSFLAEKKGAQVVAIDNDPSVGAKLLKEYWNSEVEFRAQSLYDLKDEKFDVILCLGVIYHLRYPMKGLKALCDCLPIGGKLYLEGGMLEGVRDDLPLLYCPVWSSPYEPTSCTFFNVRGLAETLRSFGVDLRKQATHPDENGKAVRRFWFEAEKTHETADNLKQYWDGFHVSHST